MLFVQWNLGLRTLWFTPVSARAQRPVENIAPVHVQTFSFVVNWIFAMKPKQYPRPTATHKPKQTQTKEYVNRCSTVFYLKFGLITLWVRRRQLTITLLIVCGGFHILYSLREPLSPHPASISIWYVHGALFKQVQNWERNPEAQSLLPRHLTKAKAQHNSHSVNQYVKCIELYDINASKIFVWKNKHRNGERR